MAVADGSSTTMLPTRAGATARFAVRAVKLNGHGKNEALGWPLVDLVPGDGRREGLLLVNAEHELAIEAQNIDKGGDVTVGLLEMAAALRKIAAQTPQENAGLVSGAAASTQGAPRHIFGPIVPPS